MYICAYVCTGVYIYIYTYVYVCMLNFMYMGAVEYVFRSPGKNTNMAPEAK